MMKKVDWKRKLKVATAAGIIGLTAGLTVLPSAPVHAAVLGNVLGTVVAGAAAYQQLDKTIDYIDNTEQGRRELFQAFQEKQGVVENAYLQGMLDRVMSRVSAGIAASDPSINQKPYLYFINKDKSFNAFCSMGHVMSVNQGLFDLIQNEDEIAVVLGHEMGHGQKNHVAKAARKRLISAIGLSAIANSTGAGVLNKLVLNTLAGQINNVHITKPGEWEADNLAFDYITAAGYNPGATAAIWQRVTEAYGKSKKNFVGDIFSPSDHPTHEQRIANYVKKLNAMSGKHATAEKGVVKVNGKSFVKPAAADGMSGAERSYFVLGNLAAAYQNGHAKQNAYASGNTVMLGQQPIIRCASGDPSASELAALLNNIK